MHFKRNGERAVGIRKLVALGRFESSDLAIIKKLLKPGDCVIDAGAHEGYISLFIAGIVGNQGKIFSIEPNEENLDYLRKNIVLNQFKNIEVIKKAVSDKAGTATFYYSPNEGAWGSIINFSNFAAEKAIEVELNTLDNISISYKAIDKISLCKLDIEGNELKAILGAEKIILNTKPYFVFEVNLLLWAHLSDSIETMFNFLAGKGYKLFIAKNNKLEPYDYAALNYVVLNIFAIHESRIEELFLKGVIGRKR